MNTQALNMAKTLYQRGDWAGAANALSQVKAAGEVCGEADHLRGNAFMKLGMFNEAAGAYAEALADVGYGHVGALNCNRGRALVAAGQPDAAAPCFEAAVADKGYATPYKAYLALGNLYSRRGMAREAGVAWRSAAIDEANPDPSGALVKLGGCFMTLGRPVDAVEAYRTALDFSPEVGQGAIYADLGLAYMAANRVAEASDAFTQAISDPTYHLTPEQQTAFSAAQKAMSALNAGGPSETDQMLAGAGYGAGAAQQQEQQPQYQQNSQQQAIQQQDPFAATSPASSGTLDPLDPLGKSGEFIPSPEDTGFFSVTEEDLMKADKDKRKMERKHKKRGLKVFLVLLLIALVLAAGAGYAYYRGYGWPTQESVATDMFSAAAAGNDVSPYLADGMSDDTKAQIEAILPKGATAEVSGVDRSMTSSTVLVTATLSGSGTQSYKVTLARSGASWKVTGVELSFASQTGTSSSSGTTTTTGTLATTSEASTDAVSAAANAVTSPSAS